MFSELMVEVERGLGFGAPNLGAAKAPGAVAGDDGEEPAVCPISSPHLRYSLDASWLPNPMVAAKDGPAGPSVEGGC